MKYKLRQLKIIKKRILFWALPRVRFAIKNDGIIELRLFFNKLG